jgi:hypothetical protein
MRRPGSTYAVHPGRLRRETEIVNDEFAECGSLATGASRLVSAVEPMPIPGHCVLETERTRWRACDSVDAARVAGSKKATVTKRRRSKGLVTQNPSRLAHLASAVSCPRGDSDVH